MRAESTAHDDDPEDPPRQGRSPGPPALDRPPRCTSKARYRAPRHGPIAAVRRENLRPALPIRRPNPPQPTCATPPEPSPAAADRQIPIASGNTATFRPAVSSLEACPTPAVRARRSHPVTAGVRQPLTRAVLRRHHQEGLFLGVQPTKSGRKRTSALECQLLGVEQTYQRRGLNRRL